MSRRRGFYQGIRFKLLLISLTLLVIPWAGYRYILETERFLRQTQETLLLGIAQAVAAILHDSPAMGAAHGTDSTENDEPLIYIQPLNQPIQLDGYREDWQPYQGNQQRYPEQGKPLFETLLGEDDTHLYLLLRVYDERVLYQTPGSDRLDPGDYVQIITGSDNAIRRYAIATTSPGWVTARLLPNGPQNDRPLRREDRIQGEWQTSDGGYTVELRIPRYLLGERLALAVSDLDDPARPDSRRRVSTAPGALTGRVVRPDPAIGRLIGGLEHENARIWVLNNEHQVLSQRGRLQPADDREPLDAASISPLQLLLRMILDQPSTHFQDEFSRSARLKGPEIDTALQGVPDFRRRPTPDHKAVILSVAWPIRSSEGVVGAVLVEQSTNQILTLQNRAMAQITGITLPLFLIVGLAILGFASLLTSRIRRLRNRVESAVTVDGRIRSGLQPDRSQDEIGDLSRSFAGVLNRLSEYNRYLEEMASRLAHEFRTPLTVVKSSLENLQTQSSAADQARYIERAQTGVDRLGLILHRMREATRLEQQLQQTELETFDLTAMLEMAVAGYRQAFAEHAFQLHRPSARITCYGAPDLISQALDKLISNAVDFHHPGSPIEVWIDQPRPQWTRIAVRNKGPALPEGMQQELFASMVSIREHQATEPHLGLGLYLVRLISEFHGGHAEARNLASGDGVEFSLLLAAGDLPDSSGRTAVKRP